jgi:predicted unusual protein kinase regulating ubiquinone biosynthesis (AarF/ABC1/UbiB family)
VLYDPVAIAEHYARRPLVVIARIAAVAVPVALWYIRARGGRPPGWPVPRRGEGDVARSAADLRTLITWAGATALKLGQAASSRPDVVGPIYMVELQKLTDDVEPFDSETAQRIVCDELDIGVLSDAFRYFDPKPTASASLGQVHRAQLLSGQEVAVKVQRPRIKELAALDLYIIRQAAAMLKQRFKLRSDLVGIVDEFGTQLWQEVDYNKEAENAELFRTYYGTGRVPGVYVPIVYREYTTKRVLTMEWIDGDKPPWLPKEDADALIAIGVNCSLDQLLGDYGLVHGDPHAGNLFRRVNPEQPHEMQLVWLDFGMCIQVERETRVDLIRAITHLTNRNYDQLALDFARLGFLMDGAETAPLIPKLQKAFAGAESGGRLSDLSFSKLADNLAELASTSPIRIPVAFTVLIRSLTILEGLALQSDPSFKIIDAAYPYVVRRLLEDDTPALREALKEVLIDSTGRIRWNRLSSILKASAGNGKDVERPRNVASALLPSTRSRPGSLSGIPESGKRRIIDYLLSPKGDFLREALTRELTEIADALQLEAGSRLSAVSLGLLPAPKDKSDPILLNRAREFFELVRNEPELGPPNRTVLREFTKAGRTVLGEISVRNARRAIRGFGDCALDTILGPASRPGGE